MKNYRINLPPEAVKAIEDSLSRKKKVEIAVTKYGLQIWERENKMIYGSVAADGGDNNRMGYPRG